MRWIVIAVYFAISLAATNGALADSNVPRDSFIIEKMKARCGENAESNADTRNCIENSGTEFASKFVGKLACAKLTCVVKLPCVERLCKGQGYTVKYAFTDQTYWSIHIKLPSGRKIEYIQCGTCLDIEPATESEITVELLPGDGVVFLEFPKQYK